MQSITASKVLVWSRRLRLIHWTIGISSLGLAITGILMASDTIPSDNARDLHYIFSGIVLPAFLIRIYMFLFGIGTERINDCELDSHRFRQALKVLLFYLSLGKPPLPKWFSHNPLWGPIYLTFFFFLFVSCMSGLFLINGNPIVFGVSNYDLHQISHYAISIFITLHIPAVFIHDLNSQCCDISGMVSGYKTFSTERPDHSQASTTKSISIDELLKSIK